MDKIVTTVTAPSSALTLASLTTTTTPPRQTGSRCSCNILCLHEEIIRHIFEYLPDLSDKVRLACVATKFREAFDDWASKRQHTLNAEDVEMMQLTDIINFFTVAGPFITDLHVDCASFQKESLVVEFISEFCKNIQQIHFINVTDNFHYRDLLSRLTKLRRVVIHCLDADDVLNYNLEGNTELEYFELINGCYTGKNLCGFPNLRKLVLRECLLWNSWEFGIPLKTLQSLELDDCCFEVMNQSLYKKIADCCGELKELFFSGCDTNFDVIAELPNLQRCTLKTWMTSNELNIGFLGTLADKKGHKLVYLKLWGQFQITYEHMQALGQLTTLKELRWHINDVLDDDHFKYLNELHALEVFGVSFCGCVTDMGLMRLLRKCQLLQRIDIRECDQISNQFVLNAISFCSKGAGHKLLINVDNSQITDDLLKHADYLTPANHVKLNFTTISD